MGLVAYVLVLYAFRLAPAAYVVAAREVSILFSVAAGSLEIRERQTVARVVGATLIVTGVALLGVAR